MPRGSVRADADLDEGRLGHGRRDRAAAYVDHDLVTQADRAVAEGERDALLQGGAEGAGRDLADDVAVGILDLAVAARDAATGDEQATGQACVLGSALGSERFLPPEGLLVPADRPGRAGHDGCDVERQVIACSG